MAGAGVSSIEWLSSGMGWGMRGCGGGCGIGIWTDTFMSADDPSYVFSPVVSEFPLIFFSFLFLLLVFVAVFFW